MEGSTSLEEAVAKDRCDHPDCYYSTSSSRQCRTVNGESVCEVMRRAFSWCFQRPIFTFACDRSSVVDRAMVSKLRHAQAAPGILLTDPRAMKILQLKLVRAAAL